MPIALERVLVDLADGGVVRSERRRDAVRHLRVGQPFGDLLSREVDVDVILERHDDLRQAERRDRALHQRVRHADQGALDGNGDLLFHLLRRLSGEERDDHHLDVGDVRKSLDFETGECVDAEQQERNREEEGCDAPVDSKNDQAFEHC